MRPVLGCVRIFNNHYFVISTCGCPDGGVYAKISGTARNDYLLCIMLFKERTPAAVAMWKEDATSFQLSLLRVITILLL